MAGLRTATAINVNLFEGGDSNITAPTLVGAFQEIVEKLDLGIASYNASNELLPYPDIDVSYAAGNCSGSIPIPMEKVAGEWEPSDYLDAYIPWVVPTSGELVGKKSALEAYIYIIEALGDANDLLRPGAIITSARGTTSNSFDKVAKQTATSFNFPYDTVVGATTGEVKKVFQNIHIFTDLQQGQPIV
jgi:hypothetical protein